MLKVVAVVAALGLVVGVLWTRGGDGPSPSTPTTESVRIEARTAKPRLAAANRVRVLPALKRVLPTYAPKLKLADEQWEQFTLDVSELAGISAQTWRDAHESGEYNGLNELSETLADELEARAATYMSPEQLAQLRYTGAYILVVRERERAL